MMEALILAGVGVLFVILGVAGIRQGIREDGAKSPTWVQEGASYTTVTGVLGILLGAAFLVGAFLVLVRT